MWLKAKDMSYILEIISLEDWDFTQQHLLASGNSKLALTNNLPALLSSSER